MKVVQEHTMWHTLRNIGVGIGRFIMAAVLFYIFMKMDYCYWILLAL
jgi:hypothetical protein